MHQSLRSITIRNPKLFTFSSSSSSTGWIHLIHKTPFSFSSPFEYPRLRMASSTSSLSKPATMTNVRDTLSTVTVPSSSSSSSTPVPGDHMKEGMGLPSSSFQYRVPVPVTLEKGDTLSNIVIGYNTYGTLSPQGDNAVIVGHSLTSNSCIDEWWKELIGPGAQYILNTNKYFIICCNYLGSVYGSSSPLDTNPVTGKRYAADFPVPTIRDNVRIQRYLLDFFGVKRLAIAIGGSLGGMLALEWACTYPSYVDNLILIATCARHTDWAIGMGEVERQAIYADHLWKDGYYDIKNPPLKGMSVARQFAMLSYRTPQSFTEKFNRAETKKGRSAETIFLQGQGGLRATLKDRNSTGLLLSSSPSNTTASTQSSNTPLLQQIPHYEVERYLNYQGEKFIKRFDPLCYVRLTQLLDSHDIGYNRYLQNQEGNNNNNHHRTSTIVTVSPSPSKAESGMKTDYRKILQALPHRTLIVGIDSDLLYPVRITVLMMKPFW